MPYPDVLDDLTTAVPTGGSTDHEEHTLEVATAVEALQAKVGTGDATPTEGTFLYGDTPDGTTEWASLSSKVNPIIGAYIGADFVQRATVTLSSAQILDLHNTPVELVPAPGAGKWLNPHQLAIHTTFGTVAYTVNDTPALRYDGDSADLVNLQNVGSAASSVGFLPVTNGGNIAATAAVNKALTLAVLSAITDGDGTLTITVWYSVEDI